MTYSARMIEAARRGLARKKARFSAAAEFVSKQSMPDGGFRGRSGSSDLYYTSFAIDCMCVSDDLRLTDRTAVYLESFGAGDNLDLVHLTALAGAWAGVRGSGIPENIRNGIARNIRRFRSCDGGYGITEGNEKGSIYGAFFACKGLEDLQIEIDDADRIRDSVLSLRTEEGLFSETRPAELPTTNAVAAAALLLSNPDEPVDERASAWLAQQACEGGGYRAGPFALIPDMVSTAAALFALNESSGFLAGEECEAYVESLQDKRTGGFTGHSLDDKPDCEYTFYGLLSLGCCS